MKAEEKLKALIAGEEQALAKLEERVLESEDRGEKLHVRALQRDTQMRIEMFRDALNFLQGEKEEE